MNKETEPRSAQYLAQSHTLRKWWHWVLGPGLLIPTSDCFPWYHLPLILLLTHLRCVLKLIAVNIFTHRNHCWTKSSHFIYEQLMSWIQVHSSIFAWRIPWSEEPGRLQSLGHKKLDTTEWPTLLLLYNVALVPGVWCCESAMCLHLSPLFWVSFPLRSPQSIE